MGECPLSAVGLNHVLLTHPHGDHSRCLMRHNALRSMMNVPNHAVYYIADAFVDAAQSHIQAESRFEGVAGERFVPPDIEAVRPGERFSLRGRHDLIVLPFPVKHSIPGMGYTISSKRKKLKPQYQHLEGSEIRDLKFAGVEITDEVHQPLISFLGDCLPESLWEQRHVWASPSVVCECTFMEKGEEAMARKKGHTHLTQLAEVLERIGEVPCEQIILTHFSMKYPRSFIVKTVERTLPPKLLEKVTLFC
jgi:ribonuclease Z